VIGKGREWGRPARSEADVVVVGDDRALAAQVAATPGALVAFRPNVRSALARAIGLAPGDEAATGTELTMDALDLEAGGDGPVVAVNLVVFGTPPERLSRWTRAARVDIRTDDEEWFAGRASTVVIAVGQWRHGVDLVPRGHPGDGRVELQAYAPAPGERRAMRRRLASGSHLPHPRIMTRTVRRVAISAARPLPLEVDGEARPTATSLVATVRSGAYRLLV